ncbi:hypothetical protein BC941DRAFT_508915 [Chlamydoabsidia padenii]|nr:hypothetical protein BC941DRAFT_508915 [Chlamydoabsidia padenii]
MTLTSSAEQVNKSNNVNDTNGVVNIWSPLDKLHAIEQDIKNLLTQHEGLTYNDMADGFEAIKAQLTIWMENAHLTIFTLEQKAKEGATMSSSDLASLQTKMAEMEGLMGHFGDISELMDEKFDDTTSNMEKMDDTDGGTSSTMALAAKRMAFKMGITKLQSEWSGLHHFMVSVTKQVESANEKQELLVMMENIILDIDNLTSTIFEHQEKRHMGLMMAATEPGSATATTLNDPTTIKVNGETPLKDETLLADLDQRVQPVFLGVEKIYARMNSTTRPPQDDSGILVRKHRMVQEKWECLRIEIDELKDELKEDRWLSVFRQVADQVDTMINGLNKAVQDCYNAIQQIHNWHESIQQQNYSHTTNSSSDMSSPHSPSPFDKVSKTFMRSLPRNQHSSASVTSSTTTSTSPATIPPPPFDHHKFMLIEKNFEAKYTHYTPSVDHMLLMLGNGIASRSTKNNLTCKRHSSMLSRWQQLKVTMEDLRSHDLANAERYLVETPLSPVSSVQSDKSHPYGMWKGIRRRASNHEGSNTSGSTSTISSLPRVTSSTSQHEDYRRVRSVTPSSGSYHHQATKPYSRQHRTTSPLNFYPQTSSNYHNRILRPSTSETSSIESGSSFFRSNGMGRKSLTPRPAWNTSVKTDNTEFSSLEPLWKGESRATSSGLVMDNGSSSSSSSSGRYYQGRKSLVPRPPSSQQHHSFMKPTKSTMLRKRSQSVEPQDISRSRTPTYTKKQQPSSTIGSISRRRTKTPLSSTAKDEQLQYHLPPRPKSSLGRQESHHLLPYVDRERDRYNGAKSPIRRSGTPSLIPRPKTPNSGQGDYLQSTSPSLIPRPRSSMRSYYQDEQDIPPVPPLPSNIQRPSIHLLKVGILNKDDVYDDVEHDDNDTPPLPSFVSPDSFLSVPSVIHSTDEHNNQRPSSRLHHSQQYHNSHDNDTFTRHYGNTNSSNNNNNKMVNQQKKRELLKKRSMPALAIQRSGSPFQSIPAIPTIRTTTAATGNHRQSISSRRRSGYYSEDEDNLDEDDMISPHSPLHDHPIYTGDPRDPLDMEVATILNSSPIAMQCQKSPQGVGKYYFGNELNPTGGKKLYTCKLINYTGRPSRRQNGVTANGASLSMITKNKVLVRVGGGWTELSQFLLDHALFM